MKAGTTPRRLSLVAAAMGLFLLIPAAGATASGQAGRSAQTAVHARRVCDVSRSPAYAACLSWVRTNAEGRPLTSLAPPPGFGPRQFHTGYALPTTTGASATQTIAIVDAYNNPHIYADLKLYIHHFRLPPLPECQRRSQLHCFVAVNQQGKGTPLPPGSPGWGLEEALDVQTAYGICQNCRIELVEASSASFKNLSKAVNAAVARGADVVSNSYGSYLTDCPYRSAYDHPNVAVVVSAGDSGYGVACPAVLSTVISVGGSSLTLNADATYRSEDVWSGTGSGCSATNTPQPWQASADNWATIACTGRGMNDVSADADPGTGAAIFDTYGYGGWVQVGGTSLSAPLIAGVYALAGNASSLSYPAQTVYLSPSSLHDVTTGSNGNCSSKPTLWCNAGAGYDLPTGIGTPNGLGGF